MKEERRTAKLHGDMNLSSLMVYAQSIEGSKVSRISRNLKISGPSEQNKSRFKKRIPNHDGPSTPKFKGEGGSISQGVKPTCFTCGKNHF